MVHNVTARDVPELRAEMVQDSLNFSEKSPQLHPWAPSFRIADLYWVSAEMRDLAHGMAKDLPEYTIHPDDLPSDHGILVWEGDVEEAAGFAWKKVGEYIALTVLVPRQAAVRMLGEALGNPADVRLRLARQEINSRLWSEMELALRFGQVMKPGSMKMMQSLVPAKDALWGELIPRTAVSMWILLGQTLAASETVRPSKAGMKRLGRLDPSFLTNTRYVTLRHAGREDYAGEGGSGLHYSVQFPVRGHKRTIADKANPGQTREIWVRPHVRGPEGAPMLDPSRLVNVLRK